MPIKRRIAKRADFPITAEAVAAYRAGDRESLAKLWRLKPWQTSPIDAVGDCPWPSGTASARTWPLAVELRAELEAADAG